LICLMSTTHAIAQIDILKKAVVKIDRYKNVSYSQVSSQKSPFSGDWSSIKLKSSATQNPSDKNQELYNIRDLRGYQIVYNGTVRMELDLNDHTYRLKDEAEEIGYPTPYYWARFIQKKLVTSPGKIKKMGDTIINRTNCFHIKITMTDSVSSKEIYDLYLNKTTYLPVYTRQYLQGRFGKGDMTIDNVALMINEDHYADYRIDARESSDIKSFTIPANFAPEKKVALIADGNKAPSWELKNLQGNTLSNTQLKGTVTLIDFSFNACAACMLSIPVLNRLHAKYKGKGVNIITINTSDTRESVIAFAKKNNISYPILLNGRKVSKDFRVSAYPTFYLVDKQGNIAASFEGYSKELETELTAKIDKIK
jgi:peroxiredoxin